MDFEKKTFIVFSIHIVLYDRDVCGSLESHSFRRDDSKPL